MTARHPADLPLSDAFRRTVAGAFGDAGVAWLGQLPQVLKAAAERWFLTLAPPFPVLSYNYVAPALTAQGEHVVLKAGVPRDELSMEIDALGWYDGRGAVRLLAADADAGLLLLLAQVQPGEPLSALADDDAATIAAAVVMRRLWRPTPAPLTHRFPSVADWIAGLDRLRLRFAGGTGPFPRRRVERAERLFGELLASCAEAVVLHGDLHHDNILRDGEGWLAIDPKGVIGEPAYEVGALLRNPAARIEATPDLARLLARRVDLLAERLGLPGDRLAAWGEAQAVLSAWWTIEDGGPDGDWRPALRVAEALEEVAARRPRRAGSGDDASSRPANPPTIAGSP